jgi:hypothetical protein
MDKLQREVELLRSVVIGMVGRDPEGEYRPEFVARVLKAIEEKPQYEFRKSRAFLAHLR